MDLDFSTLTEYQRYKLMASLIIPRPIALVTTLSANGVVNAAPFSMFNMLGEEPPIVMISVNKHGDGQIKDTAANILASGEFVVHLADEKIAAQMHRCGERVPPEVSEVDMVGFTTTPVHWRQGLPPGTVLSGPAIVDALDSTVVVPPGWRAVVDEQGYIRMTRV